eukprot:jgi/Mesvir1/2494/Mv25502-RA.1
MQSKARLEMDRQLQNLSDSGHHLQNPTDSGHHLQNPAGNRKGMHKTADHVLGAAAGRD